MKEWIKKLLDRGVTGGDDGWVWFLELSPVEGFYWMRAVGRSDMRLIRVYRDEVGELRVGWRGLHGDACGASLEGFQRTHRGACCFSGPDVAPPPPGE